MLLFKLKYENTILEDIATYERTYERISKLLSKKIPQSIDTQIIQLLTTNTAI
jgi:hypothetical protein